jgi:endonuclease/exonuclease/phosphatase (EEP) superfamily protein YafD
LKIFRNLKLKHSLCKKSSETEGEINFLCSLQSGLKIFTNFVPMDVLNLKQSTLWTKLVSIMLIIGMLFCIITPNFFVFKWWSRYAMQITIAYWVIGLLFLTLKNIRLTLIAFICTSFLCLHLRNAMRKDMADAAKTNEPIVSVAHFNLSSGIGTPEGTLSAIKQTEADIISLQEVSPEWESFLNDSIACDYPYNCKVATADLHSSRFYSKFPFLSCDTFYAQGAPNLVIGFPNMYNEGKLYLISSYIEPPLFEQAYDKLKSQLDTIAAYVERLKSPVITLGDYNIHAFSYEIQKFRLKTVLQDSRRGYRPTRNDGRIALLEVPIDHIFYSNHFTCIEFQTISGSQSERIGIKGLYQFNKDSMMVSKSKSGGHVNPFQYDKKITKK